jgi:hypothetical protein
MKKRRVRIFFSPFSSFTFLVANFSPAATPRSVFERGDFLFSIF